MNNLDKLTEATILALQGKLVEKENTTNRVINAKIRQGEKYIDDLITNGLTFGVYIPEEAIKGDVPDEWEPYVDYESSWEISEIPDQSTYNELVKTFGKDNVILCVAKGDIESDILPKYDITNQQLIYVDDGRGYGTSSINSNYDIYNFLLTRDDRIDDYYGMTSNNIKYRNNAKYSDDTLKYSPELIGDVKYDLDYYNNKKATQAQLRKDIDTLSKTNDESFKNDDEIISKSKELADIDEYIQNKSNDDGSFNVNKSRQHNKNHIDNSNGIVD